VTDIHLFISFNTHWPISMKAIAHSVVLLML